MVSYRDKLDFFQLTFIISPDDKRFSQFIINLQNSQIHPSDFLSNLLSCDKFLPWRAWTVWQKTTLFRESPVIITVGGEPLVTPHSFFLGDCLRWLPKAIVCSGSPQWLPPPKKKVCTESILAKSSQIFAKFSTYLFYLKKTFFDPNILDLKN